jgi:hypothetical protein
MFLIPLTGGFRFFNTWLKKNRTVSFPISVSDAMLQTQECHKVIARQKPFTCHCEADVVNRSNLSGLGKAPQPKEEIVTQSLPTANYEILSLCPE